MTGQPTDEGVPTWRDYTFEQVNDGVAVLCRSDDMCMDARINDGGRYLTLGEAYDWAVAHIAEHARWATPDDETGTGEL